MEADAIIAMVIGLTTLWGGLIYTISLWIRVSRRLRRE
ncbi:MAG: MetS family NSS transporter small subunit [Actinomycetota bacterium]|nr:MetS family NSS transporter small subunit [Actinomycetota bacterium]